MPKQNIHAPANKGLTRDAKSQPQPLQIQRLCAESTAYRHNVHKHIGNTRNTRIQEMQMYVGLKGHENGQQTRCLPEAVERMAVHEEMLEGGWSIN